MDYNQQGLYILGSVGLCGSGKPVKPGKIKWRFCRFYSLQIRQVLQTMFYRIWETWAATDLRDFFKFYWPSTQQVFQSLCHKGSGDSGFNRFYGPQQWLPTRGSGPLQVITTHSGDLEQVLYTQCFFRFFRTFWALVSDLEWTNATLCCSCFFFYGLFWNGCLLAVVPWALNDVRLWC